MVADISDPKILSQNLFPVIGIGASAGGLDAFIKLIKAIPVDSGMAYILVQHLDPTHTSILPSLLQKVTTIPVVEISDRIKVMPDRIYIIPSNKMLVANDGVLQLSPGPEKGKNQHNLPIDLFFASLAEVHQTHAIGVVLSGTAFDGAQGLKAIKEHGGITFAQDIVSAAHDGMPQSAVLAGVVDFILAPEEIPAKLLDIKQQISHSDEDLLNLSRQDEDVFEQIFALLHFRKGTDFTHYKHPTIRRRLFRRMALNKIGEPLLYLKHLRENTEEQDQLYQDFLIPVTAFFRDHKIFDALCEVVFTNLKNADQIIAPIRVWVAGCSIGKEAYSIGMCIKEFFGETKIDVRIFATDISEPAIRKARKGFYSKSEVEEISPERLKVFFTESEMGYKVNESLREMCVFSVHNFLKDPPFSHIDLVSCRNVLIYMEPYLQKKALTIFHYALISGGFLLLGKSESCAGVPLLFSESDEVDKLFSRKAGPGDYVHVANQRSEAKPADVAEVGKRDHQRPDYQRAADEIIQSRYSPPGVIVTEAMDIVHFRGQTSMYLQQATGTPSHNLMKMAKAGLAFELRSIINKARKNKISVSKQNISVGTTPGQHLISIEAIPLLDTTEPHYLILFNAQPAYSRAKHKRSDQHTSAFGVRESEVRIRQLEDEILQGREEMRDITEDQDVANEELQSANEELLSSGEELQSLNEELEISKEELQSSNEELSRLNEQAIAAKKYTESIISTIQEPFVVLNPQLCVRTANRAFYEKFAVDEHTIEGKLIFDLGNGQWNIPTLRMLLTEIVPNDSGIENFEVSHDFPNIGECTMLLNARQLQREPADEKLILLSIVDITERRLHQQREKELLTRFQNMVRKAPIAICVLKGEGYTVEMANDFYLKIIETDISFIDKPFFETIPTFKAQGTEELLNRAVDSGMPLFVYDVELNLLRNKKVKNCFFNFVFQPIPNHDKSKINVVVAITEVTEQVTARKKMEAQAQMVRELLMAAPGFICTLRGPQHIFQLVNDRYQQLFGSRRIKGKPIMEALPELEGQGLDTVLGEVYNTGKPFIGTDIPITIVGDVNMGPELRYFNFNFQPMYENQEIHSILVFGYEVTEQVTA